MTNDPLHQTSTAPAKTPLDWRAAALIAILGLGLTLPYLGLRELWYPDELDIAEVTRSMYESGDWVAPRRVGVIWVDYPPMIYWVGAISSHLLGGMSAYSLRLPNALAAVLTALLVWWVGVRWFGARTGLAGGLALMTFALFVYEANSYRPDVTFTLFIAAGIFAYVHGVERRRWGPRVLGFAFLGLAMLAKGPLGLLLPGLVLTLWHGSRRQWRHNLELAPLALVSLGIYMAWFVPCARAMGADSILHELYAQNFERFVSGDRGHEQAFYYYLKNIWVDIAPWALVFPFALWWTIRSGRWREPRVQLLLWWFGTFFVFLSIAVTKRQLYLLPAHPAAALLLAPWLATVGRSESRSTHDSSSDQTVAEKPSTETLLPATRPVRVYAGVLTFLLVALGLAFLALATFAYQPFLDRTDFDASQLELAASARLPLAALAVVMLAAGCWIALARWPGQERQALLRIGLAHVALYILIVSWLMPTMEPTKTYEPQSAWIRSQIGDSTQIGMVNPWNGVAKRGAFAYYLGALVPLLENAAEVDRFFVDYPQSLVLVHDRSADDLFADDRDGWQQRILREIHTGNTSYFAVGPPLGPTSRDAR